MTAVNIQHLRSVVLVARKHRIHSARYRGELATEFESARYAFARSAHRLGDLSRRRFVNRAGMHDKSPRPVSYGVVRHETSAFALHNSVSRGSAQKRPEFPEVGAKKLPGKVGIGIFGTCRRVLVEAAPEARHKWPSWP